MFRKIKENNNITWEHNQIEPGCWKRVKEKLERMKKVCKERNDLNEQKWKIERNRGIAAIMLYF